MGLKYGYNLFIGSPSGFHNPDRIVKKDKYKNNKRLNRNVSDSFVCSSCKKENKKDAKKFLSLILKTGIAATLFVVLKNSKFVNKLTQPLSKGLDSIIGKFSVLSKVKTIPSKIAQIFKKKKS